MKTSTSVILWIVAFVFTISMSRYQRMTGPTYPIDGTSSIGTIQFEYSLKRTHGGDTGHPVELIIPDTSVSASLIWKRYKVDETLKSVKMTRHGDTLRAILPHQPPAGKLEYNVRIFSADEEITLPAANTKFAQEDQHTESAVIRFKGDVPLAFLLPHVLLMFGALLVSARTAMGALFKGKIKILSRVTLGLIVVGGLILGPIVQKYAFGAYWTGWPFGEDLTDNKTAVMALAWIVALWFMRGDEGNKRGRWWAVAAMTVTFAVYLIPHSMRGSELDYSKLVIEETAIVQDE